MRRIFIACVVVCSVATLSARTITVFPTIVRTPKETTFDAKSRDAIAASLGKFYTRSVKKSSTELVFTVPANLPPEEAVEQGAAAIAVQVAQAMETDFGTVAEYLIAPTPKGGESISAINVYAFGRDGKTYVAEVFGPGNIYFDEAKLEVASPKARTRLVERANVFAATTAALSLTDALVREKANQPASTAEPGWETDWAAAFEKARAEKKLVFVDFYAPWCGPCRRMDGQTFRDPEVRERLSRFVFLKVQYDEIKKEKLFFIPALPWYSIRDPWGRQVIAYFAFFDAPIFAGHLDNVLAESAELLAIGEARHKSDTAPVMMRLGATFDRMKCLTDARISYARASVLAKQEGDARLAHQAAIEAAVMRIRQGQIQRALDDLNVLLPASADDECKAATWLAIGFAEEKRHRAADARKAYEQARQVAPAQSPIRAQVEQRMAALDK